MDWGESRVYDELNSINPSVAINKHGVIMEVHQGTTGYSLSYRVGVRLHDNSIEWGSSSNYDLGKRPSVAINNNGYAVAVHQTQSLRKLMYQIGEVNAGSKTVTWHPSHEYDNGKSPSVAISDNGTVVDVHVTGNRRKKDNLYYRIGDMKSRTVSFTSSKEYAIGTNPSVALNSTGQVITVHSKGKTQQCCIGNIIEDSYGKKSINFVSHSADFGHGLASSIALLDSGHLIEAHRSERSDTLWFHQGTLKNAKPMGPSRTYGDKGANPSVAAAASTGSEAFVVEVHESSNSSLSYHCTLLDLTEGPNPAAGQATTSVTSATASPISAATGPISATKKPDAESQKSKADEYLAAYNEVLASQRCIEMWFVRVILLGAPRLGKTTARYRLTGKMKNISLSEKEERPSTNAVLSSIIRGFVSTTISSEWEATEDLSDEARMLLDFFHTLDQEETSQSQPSASNSVDTSGLSQDRGKTAANPSGSQPKVKSPPSNSKFSPVVSSPATKPSASSNSARKTQHQVDEVAEFFRMAVGPKYWKDIDHLFKDTTYIKMEDTGGQPEFMDMLPALTIGPALYLLFCNLFEDLKKHYTVSYCRPSGEKSTPVDSTYTIEEVLLTALASISCFKSSGLPESELMATVATEVKQLLTDCESQKSVAYIVGTHKDKVSDDKITEFDKTLQESIKATDFYSKGLVRYSSEDRMVLPIDNMNGGEDEIEKIRDLLEKCIKRHFQKLKIPASWLVLSLFLRKRERKTADIQSVRKIAEGLGMSEVDTEVALWFLHHHAGVLMYFPELEELKDTVICDTQIVYDSVSHLIVNTFTFENVGREAADRFREKGQFSLEYINSVTSNLSGHYIRLKKLVKLLEHLNIIVKSGSMEAPSPQSSNMMYFMPCVLQNTTHEELKQSWDSIYSNSLLAPLFIRYVCGFVPIGVFPAMIANIARRFKMVEEGIKKNRVQFYYNTIDYDEITLISHPKYYAVHVSRDKELKHHVASLQEVCVGVRKLVEDTLETVTSRMNYSFNVKYQLSFQCPSHPEFAAAGREHLCVVESREVTPHAMRCLKAKRPVDLENQHLIWFEKVSKDENIPANSGNTSFGSKPSINSLADVDIIKRVSAKWRSLGLKLGSSTNDLDNYESKAMLDSDVCCERVFSKWINNGGFPPKYPLSWQGVCNVLCAIGHCGIAGDLKSELAKEGITVTLATQ